jgi:thimet oligopeptidase
MPNKSIGAAIVAAALAAGGCSKPNVPSPETPPLPVVEPAPPSTPAPSEEAKAKLITEPRIWLTVEDVEKDCAQHLDSARKTRADLAARRDKRTLENTLELLNDIYIQIDRIVWPSDLFANVSPVKGVRDASEKCMQDAMKFVADLQLDQEVYNALIAVETGGLDAEAARFLEHELRDYRRAGVDKDEAARKELAGLRDEMVKTGQNYSRAIRDSKLSVEVKPSDLKGLPEDYLESHPPDTDGKIRISTDYPDYLPAMQYASKQQLRKALYLKFLSRAYPENEAVLKKLLDLRYRYATLLGSPNWADYDAADKMAKSAKTIGDFIDKVADIARPRMKKEIKQLLKRKQKDVPDADAIRLWDHFYYINKVQAEQYKVDAKEVRKYFEYARVKEGLLKLSEVLFQVTFKKIEGAKVWHDSVEAYEVMDGKDVLGRFYLDMHPREGKYGHAAEFGLYTGVQGVQLPSAALVCNFPKPSDKDPAFMEHSVVSTFFHEFGHLMHHLIASRHHWVALSGISCEWDFVEAPSQLLEEWAWDYGILKQFAVRGDTGEPISEDLVAKMRQADEFGKGVNTMRQLLLASLSFNYHNRDPKGIDLLKMVKDMHEKYSPCPYEKKTYIFANFGHLDEYGSGYYTYMWSMVLAKDMFTRFRKAGLLDGNTCADFTEKVLMPGGAVDAADMVKNFLGRDYSFDAFKAWLEQE